MKVGIYSESTRGATSLGGSELICVTLAQELGELGHHVEIVHHDRALNLETLSERFGVPSNALHLRYQNIEPEPSSSNPWRRHCEEQERYRGLSDPYDIFINVAHRQPPRCRSAAGVLYVLFPFYNAAALGSRDHEPAPERPALFRWYRRWYHRWNWHRIIRGYPLRASISGFTAEWTRQRWGITSEVIYPPLGASKSDTDAIKKNIILSLGRFAGTGVSKKQFELMQTFRQLLPDLPPTWNYESLGGLGAAPRDVAYFHGVTRIAPIGRAAVHANVSAAEMDAVLLRSKIFWHATGFGEDQTSQPELSEHYGIATVEAMQAGCVPVVINRGAQPEIVEHGISGFLWETLDELQRYTLQLATDALLLDRMSQAARDRAAKFSRKKFVEAFLRFLAPALQTPAAGRGNNP